MIKKILVRRPGGHKALELVEAPEPTVGPGQVRVKVKAIGVNYADCIVRMGYYEAAKGQYPITPGFEFSGIIDAVGPGVHNWIAGERVLGITRFGGYATSIVVAARQVWACPEGWDFNDCAGFPAVFLTAYYGLFKAAKVESGETVLIHSAAGGAGGALLQLSRVAGCRAIGVVGAGHKTKLCRELGAETVIDKSSQDLWPEARRQAPKGYDAVFDANGVSTLRQGFDSLAPGGRLVVYGFADIFPKGAASWTHMALNYLRVPKFSPLEMTASNRAVMGFNVVFMFHKMDFASEAMHKMLGWIKEEKIRKTPLTLFALKDAALAHQAIESGKTTGKLILTTT